MLEKEIKTFEKHLPRLLKEREGQFVLIKGEEIEFFDTDRGAIEAGLTKYGVGDPFLVRKITKRQRKFEAPALTLGLINADF